LKENKEHLKTKLSKDLVKFLSLEDKWILTKLYNTEKQINQNFSTFDLNAAALRIYDFWLKELCDVYLELTKAIFYSENENKKYSSKVLFFVIERALKLFHPFMPFLTEELYQRLNLLTNFSQNLESIMLSQFPLPNEKFVFRETEEKMELAFLIVKSIRSSRMAFELGNKQLEKVFIKTAKNIKTLREAEQVISVLGKVANVEVVDSDFDDGTNFRDCSNDIVTSDITVHLQLSNMIDVDKQLEKMTKRKKKVEIQLEALEKKASVVCSDGAKKVPEKIKIEILEKVEDKKKELAKMAESCKKLAKIKSGK
ncbi:hypothetical protein MHBO_003137, partial [Bonamia ostreae]